MLPDAPLLRGAGRLLLRSGSSLGNAASQPQPKTSPLSEMTGATVRYFC
jgi:hypothetical protein